MYLRILAIIVVIINGILSASIQHDKLSDNPRPTTTSTTTRKIIVLEPHFKDSKPSSPLNFTKPTTTEVIHQHTTLKPNPREDEEEKIVVKREKATETVTQAAEIVIQPNEELANNLRERFQQAQTKIQDVYNSTKEKMQEESKKLKQEIANKAETVALPPLNAEKPVEAIKATDAVATSGEDKKSAKKVSAKANEAAAAAASSVDAAVDKVAAVEPLKAAAAETLTFNKTVDLPDATNPSDKQKVQVVGDKANATFTRTANSLSVEAHNIL